MAVIATYKSGDKEFIDAYIRIQRLWGSKEEGWSAWVAVFAKKDDEKQSDIFSVSAPYSENKNPFKLLYAAIEKLPFISDAKEEIIPEVKKEEAPVIKEEKKQDEPPKKAGRSKKN